MPLGTPQYNANAPAKEYIYAGSKLLAVSEPENPPPADLAVWRPPGCTGVGCYATWYVLGGTGSQQVTQTCGLQDDKPVPGDYDGDGKTDFSIYRPSEGKWYVMHSSDGSWSIESWGNSTDTVAPADYDGDGKTDRALVRSNTTSGYLEWYIFYSSNLAMTMGSWGLVNDIPAPADYDGDGRADLSVWRGSNERFYVTYTSDNSQPSFQFDPNNTLTFTTPKPVGSDYDGDGKADFALFDAGTTPNTKWYIRSSLSGSMMSTVTWGDTNDYPVQNDYDGDGKTDIAVWHPTALAYWHIRQSSQLGQSGELRSVQWGLAGDTPVPAYYRR